MHEAAKPAHYITYPFKVNDVIHGEGKSGGLQAVLLGEINRRRKAGVKGDIAILADDENNVVRLPDAGIVIFSAKPERTECWSSELYDYWFDQMWAYLHPDAYTREGIPGEIVAAMYPRKYELPRGTLEQMFEHYEKYGVLARSPNVGRRYAARFDPVFRRIRPGSTLNWADFFFAESILRHSERLRSMGVFQTFHHHMHYPQELDRTGEGRRLIKAMSMVDQVFLHTDEYLRRLERHIESFGYRMPTVRRFDLGVDRLTLDQAVTATRASSSELLLKEHVVLDLEQQRLVSEVLRSQQVIPNLFICLDRLDPIKGIHVVLEAIDLHLSSLGRSLDYIRRNYRFFFLMQYWRKYWPMNLLSASHLYADHMRRHAIEPLIQKYPGVVFVAENIPKRPLLASLMRNTHILTGGIQDGLGLAVLEGLYVNAKMGAPRSAIIGSGNGFAIQTIESGFSHLAEFPTKGSVEQFAAAIGRLVQAKPEALRARTSEIASRIIEKRGDSIIVGRDR
jgi:glycosyltransferase involved in cell wall biosynthesis